MHKVLGWDTEALVMLCVCHAILTRSERLEKSLLDSRGYFNPYRFCAPADGCMMQFSPIS